MNNRPIFCYGKFVHTEASCLFTVCHSPQGYILACVWFILFVTAFRVVYGQFILCVSGFLIDKAYCHCIRNISKHNSFCVSKRIAGRKKLYRCRSLYILHHSQLSVKSENFSSASTCNSHKKLTYRNRFCNIFITGVVVFIAPCVPGFNFLPVNFFFCQFLLCKI